MEFTHIKINNFCGIKALDTDLYHNTIIKGKNAVGKSTIRNAIFFVLFNKMADGTSADSIRPHDENGVDINYIDIEVELTADIDGRKVVFGKTQRQNWVKDRTTQENIFKGNVNEYSINNIPKTLKDYEAYINDNITPLDKLMLCINPFIFLNLDTKKRRAKLFEMVEDFSDDDVIAKHTEFEAIRDDLKDGSIDELIARSRKVINAKKKDLELIPARIDELSRQISNEDVSEWELAEADCKRRLAENAQKRSDYSKQLEDYNNLSAEIMGLEMELNDVVRKSNADLISRKQNFTNKIADLEQDVRENERDISNLQAEISRCNADIGRANVIIENERKKYTEVKALAFDESSTICSFCKQPLPTEKADEIRADFEKEKKAKLESITEVGNANAELIKHRQDSIKAFENSIKVKENYIKGIKDTIDKTKADLDALAEEIDLTTIPEYTALEKVIADKKISLSKLDAKELNIQLQEEMTSLNSEMVDILKHLSANDRNIEFEARIEELKEEQINTSQMIADEERMLDIYSSFQIAKVDMITDKINSYFTYIKFRLFRQLINGGFEECCEPMFNGTSYDRTLNHGAKILCEMDICKAFQKANKIEMPILIDDSESVDGDKIPKLDTQIISIRRTDDNKLTIEEF